MPQDDPHSNRDTGRRQRGGGPSQQMRSDAAAATETFSSRMADVGAGNFNAGLRMQTEMFDTLHTIGNQWLERKTHEAELALNCRIGSPARARFPRRFPPIRNG
jgi:hypothetical protein